MNQQTNHALPDPAWHYYMVWGSLHQAKIEIDQALAYIKECEVANSNADRIALASVRDAIATLRDQAVVLLTPEEPT